MTSGLQFLTFLHHGGGFEDWAKLKENIKSLGNDFPTSPQLCAARHAQYGTQRRQVPISFHPDRPRAGGGLGGSGLSHPLIMPIR